MIFFAISALVLLGLFAGGLLLDQHAIRRTRAWAPLTRTEKLAEAETDRREQTLLAAREEYALGRWSLEDFEGCLPDILAGRDLQTAYAALHPPKQAPPSKAPNVPVLGGGTPRVLTGGVGQPTKAAVRLLGPDGKPVPSPVVDWSATSSSPRSWSCGHRVNPGGPGHCAICHP